MLLASTSFPLLQSPAVSCQLLHAVMLTFCIAPRWSVSCTGAVRWVFFNYKKKLWSLTYLLFGCFSSRSRSSTFFSNSLQFCACLFASSKALLHSCLKYCTLWSFCWYKFSCLTVCFNLVACAAIAFCVAFFFIIFSPLTFVF